jgi:putative transcriptional regulator
MVIHQGGCTAYWRRNCDLREVHCDQASEEAWPSGPGARRDGQGAHRLGGLSDDEFAKITLRDVTLEKLDRTGPPSPREIVAIREGARMNQAVFARLLDVSTGTLSKWERGQLKPRGPAGRLLRIIKRKGIEAVL